MGELAVARVRSTSAGKRRRALALVAVAVAFITTGTYWLAAAGTNAPEITAPAGLTNGQVADVVVMSSTVTRSVGSASLQTGKTIAKLKIAKDYTDKLRVSIIWTNPLDAAKVLNNPNAQISIGLYRPVSTTTVSGSCGTTGAVKVSDGAGPTYFCTVPDSGATGSFSVSNSGLLLLAQNILTGYLRPAIDGSTTAGCAADSGTPTTWCQPSTEFVTADQRLLYVIASVTTPGGIPVGQVNTGETLKFYVQTRRSA